MSEIKKMISLGDWNAIVSKYSVEEVCLALNFSEAMHLVKHLFYDDIQDDEKQQYGLKLCFKIKDFFVGEWERDWKNEVFLGGLCEMLWMYDERYLCYKRAYDTLQDPPMELLLFLSGCNSAPGIPPISDEEAELYLRRALDKKLTFEVALKMRALARLKKDDLQEQYWDEVYKKLEKEGVFCDQLIPDVLKE